MSAHPMIQPSDWSTPPEALVGEWPADRLALYQRVWDMALACVLAPPLLHHARWLAEVAGHPLAIATRVADPDQPGYWRLRTDYPTEGWPVSEAAPDGALRVIEAHARPWRTPTLADLIGAAAEVGAGSPASWNEVFHALIEERAWVAWDADTGRVALTPAGQASLADWPACGLGSALDACRTQARCVDAVRAGADTAEALRAAGIPDDRAEQLAAHINQRAEAWAGTPQAIVLAEQLHTEHTPPKVPLPSAFDPERWLAADDPLRALRQQMERALAEQEDWYVASPLAQAQARRDWLEARAHSLRLPTLRGEGWWLNGLALWLVGASPVLARQMDGEPSPA